MIGVFIDFEEYFNVLDVKVGDGDIGFIFVVGVCEIVEWFEC